MAKKTKVQRSNAAHLRLQRKYSQLGGHIAMAKEGYHEEVRLRQEIKGRCLGRDEKKKIYDHEMSQRHY